MSLDITKWMKSVKRDFDNIEIDLSAWVRDQTKASGIAQNMTITTGAMHLYIPMEKESAEQLIEILHQHIANIKECELELLALQTKAAA